MGEISIVRNQGLIVGYMRLIDVAISKTSLQKIHISISSNVAKILGSLTQIGTTNSTKFQNFFLYDKLCFVQLLSNSLQMCTCFSAWKPHEISENSSYLTLCS